jgi:aspartyl-tRNA synthetase
MKHSVTITTPMLTVDEVVRQYGVSKADQKFVASLFETKRGVRQSNVRASKLRISSSSLVGKNIKLVSGKARTKRTTKSRARKVA